jgi:hypothetical protein
VVKGILISSGVKNYLENNKASTLYLSGEGHFDQRIPSICQYLYMYFDEAITLQEVY